MDIILLALALCVCGSICLTIGLCDYNEDKFTIIGIVMIILAFAVSLYGCFNGFINHKPTSGTHQGVITAVDLEGTYFRRYEVYLKSGGYVSTGEGLQSDETKYCLYENETELADKLKDAIGKTVKITYGHDGGKIAWNSCGEYHIKSVEVIHK